MNNQSTAFQFFIMTLAINQYLMSRTLVMKRIVLLLKKNRYDYIYCSLHSKRHLTSCMYITNKMIEAYNFVKLFCLNAFYSHSDTLVI